MIIWIITVGEPLPTDKEARIFRAGILANALLAQGHKVVRWASTFDHYLKKHQYYENIDMTITDNYMVRYLHGSGYKRNISIGRLYDHYKIAKEFKKLAKKTEEKPDVIISSFPTIELSYQAVKYGNENDVPVVLDVRDLWPEIFIEEFPGILKRIGKLILKPYFDLTKYAFENASGVTGITKEFMNWGLSYAKREKGRGDEVFPFGYQSKTFSEDEIANSMKFWRNAELNKGWANIAVISGIGGQVFNVDIIVEAAKLLHDENVKCQFIICGVGNLLDEFKEKAIGLSTIKFMGWIKGAQISVLMSDFAIAGLIPYKSRKDFIISIPNKVPEYMSAGLPVISTLSGVVKDIIEKEDCGFYCGDAESLALTIKHMINRPDELKRKGENALKVYKDNFDSEVVYNNMVKYLEEIVISKKQKKANNL